MGLAWYGAEIAAAVTAASVAAVDETTKAAADAARGQHWWQSRGSGNLERQTVTEPARVIDSGAVAGRFGTTQRRGFYGLFLELERPFLRPAADSEFPRVGERMRTRLHG